jgi:hypothetical protein
VLNKAFKGFDHGLLPSASLPYFLLFVYHFVLTGPLGGIFIKVFSSIEKCRLIALVATAFHILCFARSTSTSSWVFYRRGGFLGAKNGLLTRLYSENNRTYLNWSDELKPSLGLSTLDVVPSSHPARSLALPFDGQELIHGSTNKPRAGLVEPELGWTGLSSLDLSNKTHFYLRRNTIYNKSRYSRNKQNYRTGVFWCLWLTVLSVLGLYFYFYTFLIKFTYAWVLFFIIPLASSLYGLRNRSEQHWRFLV